MCFDLDMPADVGADPSKVIPEFLELLNETMIKISNNTVSLNKRNVRILQSLNMNSKISFHVIVLDHVFPTMDHQHSFTKHLIQNCMENPNKYSNLVWYTETEIISEIPEPPAKRRKLNNGKAEIDDDEDDDIEMETKKEMHCCIDPIHSKNRAFRMPFCSKHGKNNFLIPMVLTGNELTEAVFSEHHLVFKSHPSNLKNIMKLKEYFVCINLEDITAFSIFSASRSHTKKRNKRCKNDICSTSNNLNDNQKKQLKALLHSIDGFSVNCAKVELDMDQNITKYTLTRVQPGHCLCCKREHSSKGALIFPFRNAWYYQCYSKDSQKISIAPI